METKHIVIGLAVGLFAGLLVGGGYFYFQRSGSASEADQEAVPTLAPIDAESEIADEPTTTPEPTSAVSKGDITIQVLNGSGAPGAAGDGQALLQNLGYENISVGNAGSFDYEETEIYVKEDKKEFIEELKNDLEQEYEVSVQSEYLEEDAEYDIRIIIGASS